MQEPAAGRGRVRVPVSGRLHGFGRGRALRARGADVGGARHALRLLHRERRRAHAGRPDVAHADGQDHRRADPARRARLPFISVLTDPTMGGVSASFAMHRRRGHRRAQCADRLRRSARHRADRAPNPARRLPARRVPAGAWRHRHDRRPSPDARQIANCSAADARCRRPGRPPRRPCRREHDRRVAGSPHASLARLAQPTSSASIRSGPSRWGSIASRGARRDRPRTVRVSRHHRRRHQRQGFHLRDARSHAIVRRLPRRPAIPRRTCCATTSACASRAGTADAAICAKRSRRRSGTRRHAAHLFRVRHPRRRVAVPAQPGSTWPCSRSGLGGRLDAVNAFDADCAVVTCIGPRSHGLSRAHARVDRLREGRHLARRSAGGARRTGSAAHHARACSGRRRAMAPDRGRLSAMPAGAHPVALLPDRAGTRGGLPHPALRGAPARQRGAAITALDTLRTRLPVSMNARARGPGATELPGRFQVLPGRPVVISRRGPQSACRARSAEKLGAMTAFRATRVFAMLRDKDIEGVARVEAARRPLVSRTAPGAAWRGLAGTRGGAGCRRCARPRGELSIRCRSAPNAARNAARLDDRIVVFGSFLTVAQALEHLERCGRTDRWPSP